MLASQLFTTAAKHVRLVVCRRNIGVAAPVLQKSTEPIQQLFIDKIREYKKKAGGDGKLVDATPETERELKNELDKVLKAYGGSEGEDMTKFPQLNFPEAKIDPIIATDAVKK